MTTDWILRVGDGVNFRNSSRHRIWGINSMTTDNKYFINNVKQGDRLWFVQSKANGILIAVATYWSHNLREVGPLINMTMTNEELGWTREGSNWISDTEIHYTDLNNIERCGLLSHIQSAKTIRKYNEKCRIELPVEYAYIVKYSKIALEM